jgi:hypothetical protein
VELNSAEVQINTPAGEDEQASSESAGLQPQATSSSANTAEIQNTGTGQTEFDFNSDGQVNSVDLSLVYSAWGKPETDTQKKADINGDGVVNGLDYSKFLPYLKR